MINCTICKQPVMTWREKKKNLEWRFFNSNDCKVRSSLYAVNLYQLEFINVIHGHFRAHFSVRIIYDEYCLYSE